MKRRLNIITFIFIGIIICASLTNVYLKSDHLFKSTEESTGHRSRAETGKSFPLRLDPEKHFAPDSLYNEKTGEWMPARIKEVIVYTHKDDKGSSPLLDNAMHIIFILIAFSGCVMIIYNFIKIIVSVNKSVIFAWINVRRLRRIGLGFIIVFIADAIISIYGSNVIEGMISLSDYSIIKETFSIRVLIDGMTAFIAAEIIAVGLRLKEEQDLTI